MHFALLVKIAARNGLAELSMGMSDDLEAAVQGDLEGKNKKDRARVVGKAIAAKLLAKSVAAVVFDRNGRSLDGTLRFDTARNWALVRALLEDPGVEIQYLFVHNNLRRAMLQHAHAVGDDADLVDRADALLRQPGDSLPHDDHLHVRIYCSAADRPYGCRDQGPVRWWKKRYKYMPPAGGRSEPEQLLARLSQSRYFRVLGRLR